MTDPFPAAAKQSCANCRYMRFLDTSRYREFNCHLEPGPRRVTHTHWCGRWAPRCPSLPIP
jgi:hypothetical protein